jgi:hypothetical protein
MWKLLPGKVITPGSQMYTSLQIGTSHASTSIRLFSAKTLLVFGKRLSASTNKIDMENNIFFIFYSFSND